MWAVKVEVYGTQLAQLISGRHSSTTYLQYAKVLIFDESYSFCMTQQSSSAGVFSIVALRTTGPREYYSLRVSGLTEGYGL